MITALAVLALFGAQDRWTWTLYEDAPVVLAREVPDTPRLSHTLECAPGSSVARLTFYEAAPNAGAVRASAGEVSAPAEIGGDTLTLRTDHPVFAAFAATGRLTISQGDRTAAVEIETPHLPKLRRFVELCSG